MNVEEFRSELQALVRDLRKEIPSPHYTEAEIEYADGYARGRESAADRLDALLARAAVLTSDDPDAVPPEPPVGTWVRDRHGGTSQRQREGWAAPGIVPLGRWPDMWKARGPLVPCGPWGAELSDARD
jgi:hypothetical protein